LDEVKVEILKEKENKKKKIGFEGPFLDSIFVFCALKLTWL
jgi:hypothetical protein